MCVMNEFQKGVLSAPDLRIRPVMPAATATVSLILQGGHQGNSHHFIPQVLKLKKYLIQN